MAARMWLGATTLTNGAEPLPSRALWWRPSTTLSALAMESTRSPCFCFISKEEDSGQAHHCINDWDCTREGVEREWAWQVLEAHNVTKEADRLSGWSRSFFSFFLSLPRALSEFRQCVGWNKLVAAGNVHLDNVLQMSILYILSLAQSENSWHGFLKCISV